MEYLRRLRKAEIGLNDNDKQNDKVNMEEEVVHTDEVIKESMEEIQEADEKEMNEETKAEDSVEDTSTPDEDQESGKKGFFGKKKEKKDKKDEQIEDLTDRLKRTMAEFENFRKRTDKEKEQMFEVGARSIVEKILLTVDNFERGLNAVSEEDKNSPFVEGMNMVYKQLITSLEECGVKQIEALGKEFDPNLHNAVMHEENEELGENIVSEEFQKGYIYRETVVRHSMVKVVN